MSSMSFPLFVLILIFNLSAKAQWSVGDKLVEALQAKDIAFDLDLFSLKVGDVLGLGAETGLRVFPNQDLQTYSRVEPLIFNLDLQLQLPQGAFYVGARRSTGLSGEFIRQFHSQAEAFNIFKYPPYIIQNKTISDQKIPFTADRARSLVLKDYFRYQLRTAMTISGGLGADIGLVNLNANKSYVVYGDLQIEVYKKDQNKVLVRASSLKKKEKSVGVSLKKNFLLELFEIKPLNNAVNSIIPSELVRLDINTATNGSLFAVEYEFDLQQSSAQRAYNQLMDYRQWSFWDVKKVISGHQQTALQILSINIHSVEAQAMLGLGDVRRIVKSSTHFSERSQGSSFNFRLVKGQNKTQYIEQNISLVTNPIVDERLNYRIATVIDTDDIGGWLLFKSAQKEQKESNVLFALTDSLSVKKFLELNFSYERSDVSFNVNNQRDTAGQIYALLPGDLHGPGVRDFVEALQSFHKDEVYVRMDLSLEPRALVVVNRLSKSEMQQVVLSHIEAVFRDQAIPQKGKRDYGDQGLSVGAANSSSEHPECVSSSEKRDCFYRRYRSDIQKMLEYIPQAIQISDTKSFEAQWAYQTHLQNIDLYKKIGSGLMTRLLMAGVLKKSNDPDQFYRFAKLKLQVRGRQGGIYVYEKGRDDQMDYIQEILKIRNRILNREFDPIYFD